MTVGPRLDAPYSENVGRPLRQLPGPEKTVTVEVDHVIGHFGNPDFSFPRDGLEVFSELSEIRKGRYIDSSGPTLAKHCFELNDSLRCNRTVRSNGLDQEQP